MKVIPGIAIIVIWSLLLGSAWIYKNYFSECANAPKITEFRQGMTLCPGQSATFTIVQPKGSI